MSASTMALTNDFQGMVSDEEAGQQGSLTTNSEEGLGQVLYDTIFAKCSIDILFKL